MRDSFALFPIQFSVHACNVNFLLRDIKQLAKHRKQEAGLPRTNFTDNADQFPFLNLQVDILERKNFIKGLIFLFHFHFLFLVFLLLLVFYFVIISFFLGAKFTSNPLLTTSETTPLYFRILHFFIVTNVDAPAEVSLDFDCNVIVTFFRLLNNTFLRFE